MQVIAQTGEKAIDLNRSERTTGHTLIAGLALIAVLLGSLLNSAGVIARGMPDTFADLVEELSPAVVNISVSQIVERRPRRGLRGLPFGGDLFDLPNQDEEEEEDREPLRTRSLGSGFIISAEGLIVTNNHVVEGADEITIALADEETYVAEVVGRDPRTDLAVLKIEREEPFPFVKWGNSDAERVGDWLMAIGNPFGLGGSVSVGILSARGRAPATQRGGPQSEADFIQTDAAINRGNSGGPLFNTDGEVIGVNTAILSQSGGNVGIGFAIPSNDANLIVSELIEEGRVRRGWLGVTIQTMTEELAEAQGLDIEGGVLISSLNPEGPAIRYGFEIGDIIINWNGMTVENNRELQRAVARTRVGATVDVVVMRAGAEQTLSVTVAEQPADLYGPVEEPQEEEPEEAENDRVLAQGMDLLSINDFLRQRFRLDDEAEGVLIARIKRTSAAYRAGLRQGMVIAQVNGADVTEPSEVLTLIDAALESGRNSVLILINSRGNTAFVALPIDREED